MLLRKFEVGESGFGGDLALRSWDTRLVVVGTVVGRHRSLLHHRVFRILLLVVRRTSLVGVRSLLMGPVRAHLSSVLAVLESSRERELARYSDRDDKVGSGLVGEGERVCSGSFAVAVALVVARLVVGDSVMSSVVVEVVVSRRRKIVLPADSIRRLNWELEW